eukprot:2261951-Amphidinium_carterae.1
MTGSTNKVKLATVVSQTLDQEVEMIADSVVAEGYKTYKSLYGCYPPSDADVTHEQLTGLWTLLESKKVPYVDFSVWVPQASR